MLALLYITVRAEPARAEHSIRLILCCLNSMMHLPALNNSKDAHSVELCVDWVHGADSCDALETVK